MCLAGQAPWRHKALLNRRDTGAGKPARLYNWVTSGDCRFEGTRSGTWKGSLAPKVGWTRESCKDKAVEGE